MKASRMSAKPTLPAIANRLRQVVPPIRMIS
jgi:hypothetical protein